MKVHTLEGRFTTDGFGFVFSQMIDRAGQTGPIRPNISDETAITLHCQPTL